MLFKTGKKTGKGASLAEYALLAGLVSVVSIGSTTYLGTQVKEGFSRTEAMLASTLPSRSGEEGGAGLEEGETTPAAPAPCFDPANVGTIGAAEWSECAGMLIVDIDMLEAAASAKAGYGGDESFDIKPTDPYAPEGLTETYTFVQDGRDIFTGQIEKLHNTFRETTFNGDIGYWNTSRVTSFNSTFAFNSAFNQRLDWDFSSATAMIAMFTNAPAYDQPVAHWDVSNVTNMGGLFYGASSFDQPVSTWDVSNVTHMGSLFQHAVSFNQPLENFVGPQVVDIGSILSNADGFTYEDDLATWDVSGVTQFSWALALTDMNPDITGWDTSSAETMQGMFQDNTGFNRNLSGWCVEGISAQPADFDDGATAWSEARPNWGAACE